MNSYHRHASISYRKHHRNCGFQYMDSIKKNLSHRHCGRVFSLSSIFYFTFIRFSAPCLLRFVIFYISVCVHLIKNRRQPQWIHKWLRKKWMKKKRREELMWRQIGARKRVEKREGETELEMAWMAMRRSCLYLAISFCKM